MRNLRLLVVCLAMSIAACDRQTRSFFPTGPTPPTATPTPVPGPPQPIPGGPQPPSAFPGAPFSEIYTSITVGELVTGQVSSDDPLCVGEPLWPCQYFRLTAPSDGVLEIAFTVLPATRLANIDLSFTSPDLKQWWAPVVAPVQGGVTYQITLWEYEFPGAEFELMVLLREN